MANDSTNNALNDYFDNTDGYWNTTDQTSSAGSDWTGVFGKVLDSGTTILSGLFAKQAATNDKVLKANIAKANAETGFSNTTKILYMVGGVVLVALIAFLAFRRK